MVPVIGLGGVHAGGHFGVLPEAEIIDTVHYALDQGITLIVVLLIMWHMLRERRLAEQMEAALVLLPLILRLLMIK